MSGYGTTPIGGLAADLGRKSPKHLAGGMSAFPFCLFESGLAAFGQQRFRAKRFGASIFTSPIVARR